MSVGKCDEIVTSQFICHNEMGAHSRDTQEADMDY
jgi:hypothetical protein